MPETHQSQINKDGSGVILGKDKKYEMVLCPYEPKNLVLKSKLEDHLKTCPKKRELEEIAAKPFFAKGINFMNPTLHSCFENQIKDNQEQQLKCLDSKMISQLEAKVLAFYDQIQEKHKDDVMYRDLFKSVDIIEEFYQNDKEADKFAPQMKHMNQQNKIVDWMKQHGLLEVKKDVDRVYIEYGAGRAGLSSYVAERIHQDIGEDGDNKANIKFIIVDRDTRRGKLDKNFREKFTTIREKMDIADFDLQKFIELK